MKELLTNLLTVAINFYFLSFIGGIVAGLYTIDSGPIRPAVSLLIPVLALVICIGYQLIRKRSLYRSPGELIVGGNSNKEFSEQTHGFTISRIPVFILLLLTLALTGNFLDGISEGHTYTLPHLLILSILYGSLYFGTTRFFSQPALLAALLIAGGLLIAAALGHFQRESGVVVAGIFSTMAGLWIVAWVVYRRFHKLPIAS